MSSAGHAVWSRRQALVGHVRQPLYRNAYALIAGMVITTVLGLVFWVVAARLFGIEEVGRAQTAVNALVLLSGLGSLRLLSPLTRFLPLAGVAARSLVSWSYLVAGTASCFVAVAYVAVADGDHGVSGYLASGWGPALGMVVAVVIWTTFTIQDGALIGLRCAPWVPVKNGLYGLAKLVMLVGVAIAGVSGPGIFASWVVPAAVALIPVHLLIARRSSQQGSSQTYGREPIAVRAIVRYTAADYVGMLSELAVVNLVPLVIASRFGFTEVGYFGPVWMIGTMLDHVLVHYGSSLTVEAATAPHQLATLSANLLRRSLLLVVPLAAVSVIGAPLLVSVYGSEFASRTASVLQLCGLALLPRLVIHVALVGARVRQQAQMVVGIQIALAVLTFAVMMPLLGWMGFSAAGVAYLIASTAVAIALAPSLVTTLRDAVHEPV